MRNILIIARKEIKTLLDQPGAYILAGVFLFITSYFFFRTAFLSGEASLRPMFELLPWILLLLVSAVVMRNFSSEYREGTYELMLSNPIREVDFIFGKLFGSAGFLAICLLLTLPIPLALSLGGQLDWGMVFAQYVGAFLLLLAMASIGNFASSLTGHQTIAFITAVAINLLLIVIGLEFVLLSIPAPLDQLAQSVSLLARFTSIARGVIKINDLLYFLSVSGIFSFLALLIMAAKKYSRSSPALRNVRLASVLVIFIILFINLNAAFLSWRMDFTQEKKYSLSSSSVERLRKLSDVVTIKIYASSGMPAQVEIVLREAKDMLRDMEEASRGKLKVQIKSPDKDNSSRFEAQSAGVVPVDFNVLQGDEYTVKRGYFGLTIQQADRKEQIPFLGQGEDLEYRILSLVDKVSGSRTPKIIFTGGYQEKNLQKDYAALHEELSKRFQVEEQDLQSLNEIPSDVKVAVVAGPQKWIPRKEQDKLIKFMEKGGSLLLLLDGVKMDLQTNQTDKNMNGTMGSFKQLGVSVDPVLVYDLESNENVRFGGGLQAVVTPYPFWPRTNFNKGSARVTGGIRSIVLPWSSAINIKKGFRGKVLYSTTKSSGLQKGTFNPSPFIELPKADLKSFPVAVAGERKKGRFIMVADSDMFSDQFASQAPENIAFGLNAVDWLAQNEDLISIRAKNASPRLLQFSSDTKKEAVKYGNLIGLPLIVGLAGILHLLRRKKLTQREYGQ